MTIFILGTLLAFVVASAVTPLARSLALRYDRLDHPDERKQHARAVPRLGGVGIAAGVAAGIVTLAGTPDVTWAEAGPLLACAGIVAALGFWDDLHGIGFKRRFAVQTLVAYAMVLAGWHLDISNLPLLRSLGPFEQAALTLPVTVLWTVGLINAMNLLDGLDGLAGGVALIGFVSLGVTGAMTGDEVLLMLCAVGAAAAAGFLVFNVHPASIFMGDTGSTLLGFLMAMAGLRSVTAAPSLGVLAVPLVAFGLPLLDTATAMIRRMVHGQSPFMPDADHIHHRVLARSHSVRRAVWALWGAAAAFGALSVALSAANGSDAVQALCMLAAVVLAYVVVRQLRYVRLRVLWRKAQQRRLRRTRRVSPPAFSEYSADHEVSGDGASVREPTHAA